MPHSQPNPASQPVSPCHSRSNLQPKPELASTSLPPNPKVAPHGRLSQAGALVLALVLAAAQGLGEGRCEAVKHGGEAGWHLTAPLSAATELAADACKHALHPVVPSSPHSHLQAMQGLAAHPGQERSHRWHPRPLPCRPPARKCRCGPQTWRWQTGPPAAEQGCVGAEAGSQETWAADVAVATHIPASCSGLQAACRCDHTREPATLCAGGVPPQRGQVTGARNTSQCRNLCTRCPLTRTAAAGAGTKTHLAGRPLHIEVPVGARGQLTVHLAYGERGHATAWRPD